MTEREATKLGAELMGESAIVALGLGVLYDQHRREVEESDALEARIVALETALEAALAASPANPREERRDEAESRRR